MDGHDPHHVRVLVQDPRLALVHRELVHLINVAHEGKDAAVGGLLKSFCEDDEFLHVGAPLQAGRQSLHVAGIPGPVDELGKQRMNRLNLRLLPPGG